MDTVIPGVNRKSFFRGRAFKVIAISLAVIIAVGGVAIFLRNRKNKTGNSVEQRTAVVTRGQLVDSIAGSAPVESANRSELSPKVTATLQQINCKEGDQVKKGDVLFVLDNTDALLNIENTSNQIAQMQLNLDSTAKSVGGLTVQAPFSGQVTGISVKEDDNVNKGGALLTVTDVGTLEVTLPFSGTAAKNISVGQNATVYIPDLMLSVNGTVAYKSSKPYTTASGGELYNVEITINNPGSLKEGMKATAEIQAVGAALDSVDSGTLTYKNKKTLRSDAGGTVTGINVRDNEFVNSGDVLVRLENDDLVLTSSTNDIKMENLQSQLGIQQKQLDYYTITAPFDGTITSMGTANEGDTVKQGEVLAVVSDMNHLQFSISIDELDISQVAVGQDVTITAEALTETQTTPLAGKVGKIAMEGTSNNGVTTYPVTVAVDDTAAGKLKTGMNIDAEILVSNRQDVLMVPLEAVVERGGRSFVYVKGTGNGQSGQSGQDGQSGQFGQGNPSIQGNQSVQNGQDGQTGQNGQNRWNGQGSQQSANGQNWKNGTGTTSGSGFTRSSRSRNTSGAAIGANTSGAAFGPDPSGAGFGPNTSGSAIGAPSQLRRQNKDSYYANAVLTEVQTGVSNDTYMEIVGGLSEGQVVVLPRTSTASSSATNTNKGFSIGGLGQNIKRSGATGFQGGGMPDGGPGGF
ncbi:MAG TPA: efflux RND transporter periplasmic adaptor subunit [Clostridia bacterium]|nr:efflux RND transporter periplasmic adaptor subunit [Clostridia bacterium]